MEPAPAELERYIESTAALLQLSLPEASKPAIAANLAQIQSLVEFVEALPLPPETEAAPVFAP